MSHVGEGGELVLPALDLRTQVVLRVALSYVLYQGAVVRQKVRSDMDSLCVPNLAILETVSLWADSG